MNSLRRLTPYAWLVVLICAAGFLMWANAVRVKRVEYISGLAGPATTFEATSPTGYASGLRRMIAPEHNNDSYQWIAQTQQMLARSEWHVRHIEYDNAPLGREVNSPSVYRWWLASLARFDHLISGQTVALAVERAALYADPLLHLLFLISAVLFTVRYFGNFPAALLAFGLVAFFPLAGAFLPGQPNDHGLGLICAWWSILPLLAGIYTRGGAADPNPDDAACLRRRAYRMFCLAGLAGGLGMWISPSRQVPILAGIALGGILAAWLARRNVAASKPIPSLDAGLWRTWSLAGAGTVLAAFLLEYFPSHMGNLRLETIHPLYGIGWLGTGSLLARSTAGMQGNPTVSTRRGITSAVIAFLAVAAVPALMVLTDDRGFLLEESLSSRLTNLPESTVATTLWAVIFRGGFTAMLWAALLPALLLGPAVWRLIHRATDSGHRTLLALTVGPALVALGFACFQLRWWNMFDVVLLALLVAGTSRNFKADPLEKRWLRAAGLTLCLAPGFLLVVDQVRTSSGDVVNESEVESLIERDLAHWLANQSGSPGAVVLAPPNLTTSLFFHGGLAGLGTPFYENKEGFSVAVRIAGASSPDEAQAVARGRGLTYIVIPSWDGFLDEYARLGSGHIEHTLISLLHRWLPPRWLQPVPYHLPKVAGFEGQSVVIFQVVDVQDNATALSHLAEYFIEMGQIEQAALAGQALERLFPTDLSALVARALVEQARGSTLGLTQAIDEISPYLTRGDDQSLPWDRRVSLAIALIEGKKYELAREQVRRCLAETDEPRLRSLTTVSLYRLQLMSKGFKLSISDPRLRELARGLLPLEYRDQL